MQWLWGLDVDHEPGGIAQFERADAGRLGQTGAPAEHRLKVAKLLELLNDR